MKAAEVTNNNPGKKTQTNPTPQEWVQTSLQEGNDYPQSPGWLSRGSFSMLDEQKTQLFLRALGWNSTRCQCRRAHLPSGSQDASLYPQARHN